eukprot:TRINITY_DN34175_c0_g1_i1.p2 TRINITY_DN34175_c0_g1~~TRINITY_DN34175_c0_g1_i1.p2  ORF type:complete len:180 (-),score=34.79 TRINITY_DN34175_c0_g1_i1:168-707(-)
MSAGAREGGTKGGVQAPWGGRGRGHTMVRRMEDDDDDDDDDAASSSTQPQRIDFFVRTYRTKAELMAAAKRMVDKVPVGGQPDCDRATNQMQKARHLVQKYVDMYGRDGDAGADARQYRLAREVMARFYETAHPVLRGFLQVIYPGIQFHPSVLRRQQQEGYERVATAPYKPVQDNMEE